MAIKTKQLINTVFIDIETVSRTARFEELDERWQGLWVKKAQALSPIRGQAISVEEAAQLYVEKAGIYAEFSKVVCISAAFFKGRGNKRELRLKSFYGHDEAKLLHAFSDTLEKHFDKPSKHYVCGHNIREFDVPFLCRRMLANSVKIPTLLEVSGKKPWQIEHFIDTMQRWKFGDYKSYTSLDLLSATLGLPSPKDNIDGSQVGHVYWNDDDLLRIVHYCEKDVIAVAQIALHLAGRPPMEEDEIITTTPLK